MLIEKYMNIPINVGGDEYDPGEAEIVEVDIDEDEIRHYIDTYLSAEDVLTYAKEISPDDFEGKNSADLDFAYDLLVSEFDEHDDIPDLADLNEYIQDCVNRDYKDEASDIYFDTLDNRITDEQEHYDNIKYGI